MPFLSLLVIIVIIKMKELNLLFNYFVEYFIAIIIDSERSNFLFNQVNSSLLKSNSQPPDLWAISLKNHF
jgi:hypothetical protein